MPFKIEEAAPKEAEAITKIFLSDDTSDFLRLQLGTVDPAVLNEGMNDRLAEGLEKPGHTYVIARDEKTNEVVSFAQWVLPRDENETVAEQSPEVRVLEEKRTEADLNCDRRKPTKQRSTERSFYQA